jgi:hypothetical protein
MRPRHFNSHAGPRQSGRNPTEDIMSAIRSALIQRPGKPAPDAHILLAGLDFDEIEDYAADAADFLRLIEAKGSLILDYAALETE